MRNSNNAHVAIVLNFEFHLLENLHCFLNPVDTPGYLHYVPCTEMVKKLNMKWPHRVEKKAK